DGQKEALLALEGQAWQSLHTHRISIPEDADAYALPLSDNPLSDYEAQLAVAGEQVAQLSRVKAPGMFVGSNLYVSAVLCGLAGAALAQLAVVRSFVP